MTTRIPKLTIRAHALDEEFEYLFLTHGGPF